MYGNYIVLKGFWHFCGNSGNKTPETPINRGDLAVAAIARLCGNSGNTIDLHQLF